MAFKNLTAFGAGEITPELAERGNLDKFRTGLKTLRNCVVTKMGGLRGRLGTVDTELGSTTDAVYYAPINKPTMFRFYESTADLGSGVVPVIKFNIITNYEFTQPYHFQQFFNITLPQEIAPGDLYNLHFTNDDENLYIFCKNRFVVRVAFSNPAAATVLTAYTLGPNWIGTVAFTTGSTGSPSGYVVDYGYTISKDGVESDIITVDSTKNLPAGTGQSNQLLVNTDTVSINNVPEEVRYYRRPRGAGAWGFIGLAPAVPVTPVGPFFWTWSYMIYDFGQDADYTNQPPAFVAGFKKQGDVKPTTGLIYQNRLIINDTLYPNKAYGSRTDALEKFSRDFPLQDDSAVAFKTGSDGGAKISRFYDGRGLIIATVSGIYETPSDVLTYNTSFAIKRSSTIHDEIVPILGSDTSIFVTDKRINGVFKLTPRGEDFNFDSAEISIFSAHLLENRRIISWQWQDDGGRVLWIVRDDGVVLSLSYQEDQSLQSWARHDFKGGGKAKQVIIYRQPDKPDVVLFKIERKVGISVQHSVEVLAPKNLDNENYIGTDQTYIFKNQMVKPLGTLTLTNDDAGPEFQTGNITYNVNPSFIVADSAARDAIPQSSRFLGMFVQTTDTGAYYQLVGSLTNFSWTLFTGIFPNTAGKGAVGSIFRFINHETYDFCEYEVVTRNDAFSLELQLITDKDFSMIFPDIVTSNIFELTEIWQTFQTLTGLGSFTNNKVSVRLDGFTHASPLNTEKGYEIYTVTGGSITLNQRGANISVGWPIVQDIGTLDVDTIEQSPVRNSSSQIVNKIHLSYYKSRGLYSGSFFPEDDTITNMIEHESQFEPDDGILPMQAPMPYTRREEMVIEGDWSVQGAVCLRNVDPQPIGLMAIILDDEIIGV